MIDPPVMERVITRDESSYQLRGDLSSTLRGLGVRASALCKELASVPFQFHGPSDQPKTYVMLAAIILFVISLLVVPGEQETIDEDLGPIISLNAWISDTTGHAGWLTVIGVIASAFFSFFAVYPTFFDDMGDVIQDDISNLVSGVMPPKSGGHTFKDFVGDCIARVLVSTIVVPILIIAFIPVFVVHAFLKTILSGKTAVAALTVVFFHVGFSRLLPDLWLFVMFACGLVFATIGLLMATAKAMHLCYSSPIWGSGSDGLSA